MRIRPARLGIPAHRIHQPGRKPWEVKLMGRKGIFISLSTVFVMGFFGVAYVGSVPEKKLIVAVGQEPTTVDQSLKMTCPDHLTYNWGEFLIAKETNGSISPGLATSWKVSPDGKEIEFTLRKGVKFHSGDPLTVKDIEFSLERAQAKNPAARTTLNLVEKFEAIDESHFKIHFRAPDVSIIPMLVGGMIVSKSYYDRVGEDEFVKKAVGTGPYKIVRQVPTEYIDIERFDGYWGKKPSVREARILFIPEDATRIAKLEVGEADLIAGCPYPLVKDIGKKPGLKIVRLATNHPSVSIVFSNRNPKTPWHDRRVRLAMAYAIDWKSIVKHVLFGIPNHWAWLAPHELGYDPNLKPYPYDPRKARQLLAEAGYPKGFEFKFYYPITARFPMPREISEAIASYFEAVGIRAKLVGEEWAAHYARRRASKGPDAEFVGLVAGIRAGGEEPSYFLDVALGSEGGFSVYSNPEFDKVVAEARATVNDPKRAELIKKAVRIGHEDVAMIPIYNMVAIYAMKNNIDYTPTQQTTCDLMLIKDVTMR